MDEVPFLEERTIFPIELLRKVGQVRQERSVRPPDRSKKIRSYPYPLSAVSYCAKYEEIAQESNKPKLRSPLSGNTYIDGSQRYKHKTGIKCGCKNRSVRREIFEHDFNRLIGLLSVKPQALDLMTEIAIQVDKTRGAYRDESDLEAQKAAAIALCRRRIDAATHLYSDGVIERTEYLRRVESNEREMAHWQARSIQRWHDLPGKSEQPMKLPCRDEDTS